jgi:hypothetical protein
VPPGDAEVPFLAPLQHIGSLYATAEGGLTPYTFASNPVTSPFTLRPDAIHPPPVPPPEKYLPIFASSRFATDPSFRRAEESEVATYGMFYEGILLTGATPDDLALWHRRGFVADWERGSVMIAHFEPCPIDVVLPASTPLPKLDVGVGSFTLLRDLAIPPVADDTGELHFPLPQGPCGRVWVRPRWNGEADKLAAVCDNLDGEGHLVSYVTRSAGRIACKGHHEGGPVP